MGFLDILKGLFGVEDKPEQPTETKEAEPSDDQISVEPIDAEESTSDKPESMDAEKNEQD